MKRYVKAASSQTLEQYQIKLDEILNRVQDAFPNYTVEWDPGLLEMNQAKFDQNRIMRGLYVTTDVDLEIITIPNPFTEDIGNLIKIIQKRIDHSHKVSTNLKSWPTESEWDYIESDEQFEDMWERYLMEPEDASNTELQIFTEPSIQGGVGEMFIFDESEDGNKPFSIDYQDWCNKEIEMAVSSRSATEYKEKYEQYIESLINEHWV